MKKIVIASLFFLLFLLQLHNVNIYPETRSFDAKAHIEYINYVKENFALPLPDEGWEMFQAPLYYIVVSFLPSLKVAQYFGLLLWICLFICTYISINNKSRFSNLDVLYITIFLLSTPIILYLTPSIGNEFFTTVVISSFLVIYKTFFYSKNRLVHENIILGLLLGIALLSKATGIILLISFIITDSIKFQKFRVAFKNLWFSISTSIIIGGWFYFRNYLLYKNILYQPADYLPLSSYAQPIVERNLNFFLSPKSIISLDLMGSHYYSFLGGTYFSWFYDGHTVMLPVQEFSKAGVILIFLSFVFVFIGIKGLILYIKENKIFDIYIIYPFILISSYLLYNFKLPFYSTVKAVFISSLFIPFTYFFSLGLQKTNRKYLAIIYYLMFIYILIIIRHFWINELWYSI